jgi:hypothetical protein
LPIVALDPSERRHWAESDRSAVFSYYNKRWRFTTRRASTAPPTTTSSTQPTNALAIEDAGEDPNRWLLIGPDTAGNLLEVVALITGEGTQIVIHAMPMRDKYARLLEP